MSQIETAIQAWATWHWVRTGLSLALAALEAGNRGTNLCQLGLIRTRSGW